VNALRADLATNQKARAALSQQIANLTTRLSTLETQSTLTTQQITRLTHQNTTLARRLRDREDELREKAKLVQGAQDEMVSLGLALSMAEQKAERLEGENEELVRRWVEYKEGEVDRENKRRGWGE
jgi:chromosome segregation ATPase